MSVTSRLGIGKSANAMHNAMHCAGAVAAACVMTAAAIPAYAGTGLVPVKAISLPAPLASWDISFVDPASHTYVLGDRSNNGIDVIDTRTNTLTGIAGQGKFRGVFTGVCPFPNSCSGPNGVLIVNATTDSSGNITGGEIWAGDAGNGIPGDPSQFSTIKVLSLVNPWPLIANITTGGTALRTDEMCYDPIDNVVMAANNADVPPFATITNASTKKIIAKIPFANNTNGAEQCQYDSRTGMFYVTAPEINGPGDNSAPGGISVIDPKIAIAVGGGLGSPTTVPIVATYVLPLTACDGPQGMAIGPAPGILIGCNGGPASKLSNDASVVIDDGSTGGTPGSVLAELLNQDGPDMVDYNPSSKLYTLARSTKTLANTTGQIGMVNAISLVQDVSIPTIALSGGAHSVASDPGSRNTYVPIGTPSAASKLCSSVGGVDANGCILVLTRQISNTHDFNADTISDVLWRDTSGNVGMWLMNGATIKATSVLGTVGTNWSIVGQRDFTGNGSSDILWRDTVGDAAIWLMAGTSVKSVNPLNPVPTSWSVAGTGEFTANGTGDILWEDASGNLAIWFLTGNANNTVGVLSAQSVGKLPAGWIVVGADKKGVIFLRNTVTGEVGVWVMKGATPVQIVDFGVVPLTWTIAGIGDFDGNGSSDILWRDNLGNVGIWLMKTDASGISILKSSVLSNVGLNWSIAQTGDYNGDGNADILWIDNLGNVGSWFMNGTTVSSVVNYGNVGTTWTVQSLNSE
jgi:FG-GAP-like repeat